MLKPYPKYPATNPVDEFGEALDSTDYIHTAQVFTGAGEQFLRTAKSSGTPAFRTQFAEKARDMANSSRRVVNGLAALDLSEFKNRDSAVADLHDRNALIEVIAGLHLKGKSAEDIDAAYGTFNYAGIAWYEEYLAALEDQPVTTGGIYDPAFDPLNDRELFSPIEDTPDDIPVTAANDIPTATAKKPGGMTNIIIGLAVVGGLYAALKK